MAPTRSGNAKIARMPASSAPAEKPGHRAGPETSRSGCRTGRPVLEESTHGPSPRVYWSSSIVAAGPSLAATEPAGPASVISTIPTPVTDSACAHARTNRSGRRDAAGEPSATPARISATRTEVTLITIPHRATSTRRAIMSGPWLPNSHHRHESTQPATAAGPRVPAWPRPSGTHPTVPARPTHVGSRSTPRRVPSAGVPGGRRGVTPMDPLLVPREAFESMVVDALDALPQWMAPIVAEIAVLVEEEPAPEQAPPGSTLLGLYRGVPRTRHGGRVPGTTPDTITLFRGPISCPRTLSTRAWTLSRLVHARTIGPRKRVMVSGVVPGTRPPWRVRGTPRYNPRSVLPGGACSGAGSSSTSTAISATIGAIHCGRASRASTTMDSKASRGTSRGSIGVTPLRPPGTPADGTRRGVDLDPTCVGRAGTVGCVPDGRGQAGTRGPAAVAGCVDSWR